MMGTDAATFDVAVIGAGITGASAALKLAEEGASVVLIDQYGPAAMASGWTLAGVRQSGRDPLELPLARKAVALWQDLSEYLRADIGYRQQGNLRLARSEDETAVIRNLVADQAAAGLEISYLEDLAAVREVAPCLSAQVLAASFCPTDGHADPIATVNAFIARAEALGCKCRFGMAVTGLVAGGSGAITVQTETGDVSCGKVLLATGIKTNDLLSPMGQAIPLRRPVVTVLRSPPIEPVLAPVLGVANADLAVRQEIGGELRFTSGAEDWDGDIVEWQGAPVIRPRARAIAATIDKVKAVLPVVEDVQIESIWAGALDLTPDALPVIDHLPGLANVTVAAGFSGHGFGIGPVTGPLAAQLVLGQKPDLDVEAFRFDRFASDQGVEAPLTLHG